MNVTNHRNRHKNKKTGWWFCFFVFVSTLLQFDISDQVEF